LDIPNPGGHFDQMLRQTRAHHVVLSQVADTKAGMLITISAISTTILFGVLDNPSLRAPASMMIVTCVMTCCFAVLASMPSLRSPRKRADRKGPLFNPLFFGDFVSLSWDEYREEMENIFKDHASVYEAQIREIYSMGQYLAHKKYRHLRRAYVTLFIGILASTVVWLAYQLELAGLIDLPG